MPTRVTAQLIRGIPKKNGEVVDYYNVFANIQMALRGYTLGNGEAGNEEQPKVLIQDLFKEKSHRLLELVYEYSTRGLKWAA